jgi:hypothetical protein
MKSKKLINMKATMKIALVCAVIGWMCWSAENACHAQTPPSNLSPDLQEVVKLSQAKMPDDVIKNYITSTGKSYRLSADDIIYLNSQGVSPGVISALQTASSANPNPPPVASLPTTPPPVPLQPSSAPPVAGNAPSAPDGGPMPAADTAPPPVTQEVNFDYFRNQLAPYGTWVQVAPYGWCWRPDAAISANPDWRPYYDMGQWVYTENGWFWQSDYTWGDIPFHYGNWISDPNFGWLWVPGYTWGPAWVFWRQADTDGCIGWAPLPPGAIFVDGGWMFHGVRVGVDFDFGLGADFFVFVGYDHFHDGFFRMRGREYAFHVPRDRVRAFYGRTVLRNEFRRDEHGRLVNDGIGRDRVERLTNHREQVAHFEERNPVGDRNRLNAQRTEEAGRQAGQQIGKPGEPGHEQLGRPGERPTPTPAVNKVFRPPMPGSQRQGQAPEQNRKGGKLPN